MNAFDPAQMIEIERQARQMQAAYMADAVRAIARAVAGLFGRPATGRAA